MGQDISRVLAGWNFEPHELNVRLIQGDDGREKIQMRIDLGLLQMEMDGRPDGERPFGCESLLEHYEREAASFGERYRLDHQGIEDLFREAWQFYHRYLCLFHLGRFECVVRDTQRNLRLFAFIRKHARRRREQWRFDQSRPFVLMMRTRALAMLALGAGDRPKAIREIEDGVRAIEGFLEEYDRSSHKDEYFELEFLRRWADELKEKEAPPEVGLDKDLDEIEALRSYLQKAVAREDYEFAALLRDKIKRIDAPTAD